MAVVGAGQPKSNTCLHHVQHIHQVEVENEDGQFQAVDGDERLMQELADADEETVARQLEELQREEPPAPPPTEEQLVCA